MRYLVKLPSGETKEFGSEAELKEWVAVTYGPNVAKVRIQVQTHLTVERGADHTRN